MRLLDDNPKQSILKVGDSVTFTEECSKINHTEFSLYYLNNKNTVFKIIHTHFSATINEWTYRITTPGYGNGVVNLSCKYFLKSNPKIDWLGINKSIAGG